MKSYKLYNNYCIPCIGYGTFPQKETLELNIPIAVKHGYQLIDASDNYYNEEFIGLGLDYVSPKDKEDIIIISKFSQPFQTNNLEKCFEESLEKLHGKLDIYLLHWPYPFLWRQQWRAMEKLYLDGRCKAIGVCNFEKKHMKRLLRFCRVKPMIDQFECHPIFQQRETAFFCMEKGIQVMCYSPVARMNDALVNSEILNQIAQKYHKTVTQVILKWGIEHTYLPIPASSVELHINKNIDLFDFKLTPEEIQRIDALEIGKRIRFDPDKRFTNKEKLKFLLLRIKIFCHAKIPFDKK